MHAIIACQLLTTIPILIAMIWGKIYTLFLKLPFLLTILVEIEKLNIKANVYPCHSKKTVLIVFVCLPDLILYVPSTIFQLNRDGSSWVEPVLS